MQRADIDGMTKIRGWKVPILSKNVLLDDFSDPPGAAPIPDNI
jgi:hypothetical protein